MRLVKQVLGTSSSQDHVTSLKIYTSTTRVLMATEPGSLITNFEGLLHIVLLDPLITWSCVIM